MKTGKFLIFGVAVGIIAAGYVWRNELHLPFTSSTDKATAGKSDAPKPRAGSRRRGPGVVPVLVGKVEQRPAPRQLTVIGSAQAFATVAVKSRVDGQLIEAFFKEGQNVAKNDLLFRIDPRPFEAALRQATANLERDRAQMRKAQGDVQRYSSLVDKGFASKQKYEEARAAYGAMQGTIRAGEAAIEAVKLQLEYTTIRSPIDGATGNLLVNPGNLVKANDSQPLVVITQLRPIYVTFSVPERYLTRIRTLMAAGPVAVEAKLPGAKGPASQGRLVFVNNAVDTNSGTIQLKAEMENANTELTAGQFVNIELTLEAREDALVIPSQALQDGQRGAFVFVMKDDKTVEMRPIEVDDVVGELTVITKGLAAGETVVLDGQLLLRPGAKVAPRTAGARPEGARPEGAAPGNGEEKKQRRKKKEGA